MKASSGTNSAAFSIVVHPTSGTNVEFVVADLPAGTKYDTNASRGAGGELTVTLTPSEGIATTDAEGVLRFEIPHP